MILQIRMTWPIKSIFYFIKISNNKNIQVYASKNPRASDLQSLYYNAFDTVHDRKYVEYPVMWLPSATQFALTAVIVYPAIVRTVTRVLGEGV